MLTKEECLVKYIIEMSNIGVGLNQEDNEMCITVVHKPGKVFSELYSYITHCSSAAA